MLALEGKYDWMVYIAGGMGVLYLAIIRPMLTKRKDPLQKAPRFGLSAQREVEHQMNNLLVELTEMARQVTAQLDTRSKKLEALIDEADQKIAQLKQLTGDGEASKALRQFTIPLKPTAPGSPAASPAAGPAKSPAPAADQHAQIYALADKGSSVQQIAQATARPVGEIELILALRAK